MTASDHRVPPATDVAVPVPTALPDVTSPREPLDARLPSANGFAPAARTDAMSRYFRRARERGAHEASRMSGATLPDCSLRHARAPRTQRADVEQAEIRAAWHAAENEGWNSQAVTPRRLPPRSAADARGRADPRLRAGGRST